MKGTPHASIFPALAALAIATAAQADPYPAQIISFRGGGDQIKLERVTNARVDLIYYNSERQTSIPGDGVLQMDSLIVDFTIEFGKNRRERVTVIPRAGYVAIPDVAEAIDGESVTLSIYLAMF